MDNVTEFIITFYLLLMAARWQSAPLPERKPRPTPTKLALELHQIGGAPKHTVWTHAKVTTSWLDETTAALAFARPDVTRSRALVEFTTHPLLPGGEVKPWLN